MRIGVVAPSSRFGAEAAERVRALAAAEFPEAEIAFHPQCFLTHNHFAGPDAARAGALVETRQVYQTWFGTKGETNIADWPVDEQLEAYRGLVFADGELRRG